MFIRSTNPPQCIPCEEKKKKNTKIPHRLIDMCRLNHPRVFQTVLRQPENGDGAHTAEANQNIPAAKALVWLFTWW